MPEVTLLRHSSPFQVTYLILLMPLLGHRRQLRFSQVLTICTGNQLRTSTVWGKPIKKELSLFLSKMKQEEWKTDRPGSSAARSVPSLLRAPQRCSEEPPQPVGSGRPPPAQEQLSPRLQSAQGWTVSWVTQGNFQTR